MPTWVVNCCAGFGLFCPLTESLLNSGCFLFYSVAIFCCFHYPVIFFFHFSFWMAVENLKLVKHTELHKSAQEIYQVYVVPSSDKSVMLDTTLIRGMEQYLQGTYGLQAFFEAQKRAYKKNFCSPLLNSLKSRFKIFKTFPIFKLFTNFSIFHIFLEIKLPV